MKKFQSLISTKRIAESLEYCVKLIEGNDNENFVCSLLMNRDARLAIVSVLALNTEVALVRQKIKRYSGVSGINQLQFWSDALKVCADVQGGPLPRQPALTCLKVFGKASEDLDLLLNLVDARKATLGDRPFKTLKDLEDNSKLLYGSIIRLWANAALREHNPTRANCFSDEFETAADKLSISLGIVTLLRGTLPLLNDDVVMLPEDVMSARNLNPNSLHDYQNHEALCGLAEDLCQISVDNLKSSRVLCNDIDALLRPALISPAIRVEFLSNLLHKNRYNLFDIRLQKKHTFTSWKTWWKFRTGSY